MRSDYEARVKKSREQIASIKAEIAAIESALLPKSEATAKLDAWLDDQVRLNTEFNPMVEFLSSPDITAWNIAGIDQARGLGVLLAACLPQVRASLVARLETAYAETPEGLPSGDRAGRLEPLNRKLWDAEITEETCIVEAARAGVLISRRPNVNPRVLVEVL
jgi:hypothetical protein